MSAGRNITYAYPPFRGAPLKSVYERAGFDVNKDALRPKYRTSGKSSPRNGSLPSLDSPAVSMKSQGASRSAVRSASTPAQDLNNSSTENRTELIGTNGHVHGASPAVHAHATEGLGISGYPATKAMPESRRSSKTPSLYQKSGRASSTSMASNSYPITPVSPDEYGQAQPVVSKHADPERDYALGREYQSEYHQDYPQGYSQDYPQDYPQDYRRDYSQNYPQEYPQNYPRDYPQDYPRDQHVHEPEHVQEHVQHDTTYEPAQAQSQSQSYPEHEHEQPEVEFLVPPPRARAIDGSGNWKNRGSTASSVYSDANDVIGRNSMIPEPPVHLSPTRPLSFGLKATARDSSSEVSSSAADHSPTLDHQMSTSTVATSINDQQAVRNSHYGGSQRTSSDTFYDVQPDEVDANYQHQIYQKDQGQKNSLLVKHQAPPPLNLHSNAYERMSFDALPSPTPSKMSSRICRGCNLFITGKCVSAKDGQISGRWHKECFACSKCRRSLASEFYVLHDSPFCQQCYHEENNSVCPTCGTGIEGQCLESFSQDSNYEEPLRYHPQCLACTDCGSMINQDEYVTVNGYPYCHVHSQDKGYSGGLVERRKSRFMFM